MQTHPKLPQKLNLVLAPLALAMLVALPAVAQVETTYQPVYQTSGYTDPNASQDGKSIFMAALVPALTGQIVGALAQGAGCVFSRLLSFMGARPNYNCIDPAQGANSGPINTQFQQGGQQQYGQPQAYGQPQQQYGQQTGFGQPQTYAPQTQFGQPQGYVQPQVYPAPPTQPFVQTQPLPATPVPTPPVMAPTTVSSTVAADAARQPVFSFVVQKLANAAPGAPALDMLPSQPLQSGQEPVFDVYTDQAFAVLFATSVPGRVRLINTDVNQVVSTSSLYEAIPASDNRMPRTHEGGILMTGTPGVEWLDVEFTPCISPSLQQHPAVAGFVGSLNPCTNEAVTKRYTPAMANGKGGAATFGGKAMSFPTGGDPTQPVAIAPPSYAKGDALRFRVKINHLPKI